MSIATALSTGNLSCAPAGRKTDKKLVINTGVFTDFFMRSGSRGLETIPNIIKFTFYDILLRRQYPLTHCKNDNYEKQQTKVSLPGGEDLPQSLQTFLQYFPVAEIDTGGADTRFFRRGILLRSPS
jgi:hypothetical protein